MGVDNAFISLRDQNFLNVNVSVNYHISITQESLNLANQFLQHEMNLIALLNTLCQKNMLICVTSGINQV